MHRPRPIRNVDAGDLIEMMLVVAVATIIVIRVILELMGYPKLGSGGLHIAHVLYGGLMMIGALILVFAFLNMGGELVRGVRRRRGLRVLHRRGRQVHHLTTWTTSSRRRSAVMYVVFVVLFLVALRAPQGAAGEPTTPGRTRSARTPANLTGVLDAQPAA